MEFGSQNWDYAMNLQITWFAPIRHLQGTQSVPILYVQIKYYNPPTLYWSIKLYECRIKGLNGNGNRDINN